MLYALVLFPLAMTVVAFAVPSNRWRPWVLPLGGLGNLLLVGAAVFYPGQVLTELGGWVRLDALGRLVLPFLAVLFFLCSLYAPAYLALRSERPNRVFCANLFA